MKVDLKGLHTTHKRLADGTRKIYYWAWKGKGAPRIHGALGSAEFIANFNAAVARRATNGDTGRTIAWLIRDYLTNKGSKFNTELEPRTQDDYSRILTKIEQRFGKMKVAWLERDETRGIFKEWRGELAEKSRRQADYAWSVLSALFAHAIDFGRGVKVNPCANGGRLYHGTRRDIVWSEDQIAAFLKVANVEYPELVLPMTIALWTGLHQADVLTLAWSTYDGQFIRLNQRKGDRPRVGAQKRLEIPVAAPLRLALDGAARSKRSPIICLTKSSTPWKITRRGANGFRSSWQKCAVKAGVHKAVAFTDLRGTAVTRLHIAGVEPKRIGIFTGHTDAEISDILRRHYLHRDERAGGLAAIEATEALFAPTLTVVPAAPVVSRDLTNRATNRG